MTVTYYSQHGEDFILDQMFDGKARGFFVEVGCIDGRRFSNSLAFEERGWQGLCVEAHKDYIELLKQNRPNSIVCHCAVSERERESATFYANARASLSTLDKSREKYFRKNFGKYFSGFREQTVSIRTLESIFREYNVKEVDFVSIDIEGHEVEALKGMNFEQVRPQVFVIESESAAHENELDEILFSHGYHKSISLGQNIFYVQDPDLERRIVNQRFNVVLKHTQHPLDQTGDSIKRQIIDTRRNGRSQAQLSIVHKFLNFIRRKIR